MSDVIVVALITGGFSFAGVVLTVWATNRKTVRTIENKLEVHQAVTDTKMDELTREVREHNGFAKRMPVVENDIKHIKEEISRLQKYHSN